MKKSKDNTRIVFTVDRKQYDRLKAHCDKAGMPMAEAIRRGIEAFLKGAK